MERFTVNKRSYEAREIDFNFICDLQEAGIGLDEIQRKILPATRVYVAYCMGTAVEIAGNEINSHVINGGDLTELINVFTEKASESGFFRALESGSEVETETPKRTTKKKSETAVSE